MLTVRWDGQTSNCVGYHGAICWTQDSLRKDCRSMCVQLRRSGYCQLPRAGGCISALMQPCAPLAGAACAHTRDVPQDRQRPLARAQGNPQHFTERQIGRVHCIPANTSFFYATRSVSCTLHPMGKGVSTPKATETRMTDLVMQLVWTYPSR